MVERARRASRDEGGFTLVEVLVVILILGLLAALALPAFFNQKDKAHDTGAKETAHSAHVAIETCATNNKDGEYAGCDLADLRAIEPTIPATGVEVTTPAGGGFTVTATATDENTFSITRSATGSITYTCTVASSVRGGCPGTGTADGTWG